MALFHPDIAVVLCHTGLRVQEGHAHTAFGTETGIVAATVFDSLPVELITKTGQRQTDRQSENVALIDIQEEKEIVVIYLL